MYMNEFACHEHEELLSWLACGAALGALGGAHWIR
jgi:hypothetical protein